MEAWLYEGRERSGVDPWELLKSFVDRTDRVLNLVEGEEAVVESPAGAFEPFVVHYAETFLVPAAVTDYTIRPVDPESGKRLATGKAFVRTSHLHGV